MSKRITTQQSNGRLNFLNIDILIEFFQLQTLRLRYGMNMKNYRIFHIKMTITTTFENNPLFSRDILFNYWYSFFY